MTGKGYKICTFIFCYLSSDTHLLTFSGYSLLRRVPHFALTQRRGDSAGKDIIKCIEASLIAFYMF